MATRSELSGDNKEKITHIEESGAHLRISIWHLLINLRNNYLLKILLKSANKKCKNFNTYNVVFKKKKKEKKSADFIILLKKSL